MSPMTSNSMGPKIKEFTGAAVLALIGLVLLAVAFAEPWYTASQSGVTVNAFIYNWYTASSSFGTISGTVPGWPSANLAAFALLIVAIVFAFLGLLFGFLGGTGRTVKGWQAALTIIFSGLGFAFAIASIGTFAAYTYMANWTGTGGLWASPSMAGTGWYLALGGGILLLIGLVVAAVGRKRQMAALALPPSMAAMPPAPAPPMTP